MRIKPTGLAVAGALSLALAVAGCGGSAGSSRTSAATPAAATSASAMSAAPSTTRTSATSSSTTTSTTTAATTSNAAAGGGATGGAGIAGPAGCRAATLALSFLGGQGATGHGELGFALRNTGSQSCTTGGYPGVQFLDASGGALPTTPVHTTDDFFGHLPVAELTVKPGGSVSFRLGVTHGEGSSSGCATASGLQVIAPNDTATLRVHIPNGASECGQTTVSPVQPGDSAYR